MNIKGKRVAVLGAGRSGRAAAKLALEQGGMVTLYDAAAAPAGFENLPKWPKQGCDKCFRVYPPITMAVSRRATGQEIDQTHIAHSRS